MIVEYDLSIRYRAEYVPSGIPSSYSRSIILTISRFLQADILSVLMSNILNWFPLHLNSSSSLYLNKLPSKAVILLNERLRNLRLNDLISGSYEKQLCERSSLKSCSNYTTHPSFSRHLDTFKWTIFLKGTFGILVILLDEILRWVILELIG